MKRFSLTLSIVLLCWSMANAVDLAGLEYNIDTLETFSVGPGGTYFSLRMLRGNDNLSRLDVWLLRVDTKNPFVSMEQVLGKDAVVGTERPSAMAQRKTTAQKIFYGGVNGDFFATQGDVGRPTGLTIVNSEFAYTPSSSSRRLGAIGADGLGHVAENFRLSAKLIHERDTVKINHFNYTRNENELVLYNQHNGETTGTNQYGTELQIELLDGYSWKTHGTLKARVVAKTTNAGDMQIPKGMAVLSAHGEKQQYLDNIAEGDTLTLKFSFKLDGVAADISQCIGGDNYALIVDSGKVVEDNYWNELHPRTAFGQSKDADTLLLCVVDGRGKSVGCNTRLLGAIMQYYGCYKAVNWDGGGSSSLYIRQFGDQMNRGSDGQERAVGNAMFAVASVPEDDNIVARVDAYSPTLLMPQYGIVEPHFLAYNKYGVLLNTDLQGVTLSCDKQVGQVIGDKQFVCNDGGVLKYKYGNVEGMMNVRISDNAQLGLKLKKVIVDAHSNYAIEVQGTVGNNQISLLPSALNWTVEDEQIATVSDGILNGVSNGTTRVFAELGSYKDTLQVVVEMPETNPLKWDDMIGLDKRMEMYESANWNTKFSENNEGMSEMTVNYQTAGRQPTLDFEGDLQMYGTPTYLELRYKATELPISGIVFGMRADNSTTDITTNPVSVESGTDQSIIVNLDSAFEVSRDFSIFPIHLTYLGMQLNANGQKGTHKVVFEGMYLHYGEKPDTADSVENVYEVMPSNEKVRKVISGGVMYIEHDGSRFTPMGQKVLK